MFYPVPGIQIVWMAQSKKGCKKYKFMREGERGETRHALSITSVGTYICKKY